MYSCPDHQGREQTNAGLSGKACDEVAWNKESQKYLRRGMLNGKPVQMLIDTGCTKTMVSADYIHPNCLDNDNQEKILCVHGDMVSYPTAKVNLKLGQWSQVADVRVGFYYHDGLLYRKWRPEVSSEGDVRTCKQLVLPQQCRQAVLQLAHDVPMAGHMGITRTKNRLLQCYYWPGVFTDVANYCRTCEVCQKSNPKSPPRAKMVSLPVIEQPFQRVAMDVIGPLPRTQRGNRFILTICDYATRYPDMLRKFVSRSQKDWDEYLPYLLFAYREVPQETTGFSPFDLLYGRHVRGPLDVLREGRTGDKEAAVPVNTYVVEMRQRLADMAQLVAEHSSRSQEKQKLYYDTRAKARSFKIGDKVLVLLPTTANRLKLQWTGLFKVTRKLGTFDYEVETPGRR